MEFDIFCKHGNRWVFRKILPDGSRKVLEVIPQEPPVSLCTPLEAETLTALAKCVLKLFAKFPQFDKAGILCAAFDWVALMSR